MQLVEMSGCQAVEMLILVIEMSTCRDFESSKCRDAELPRCLDVAGEAKLLRC